MAESVSLYQENTLKYVRVNLSSYLTDVITMVLSMSPVSRTNDPSRLYTIWGVLSLQQTVVPKIIFIAFQSVINLINKYLPGWKIPWCSIVFARAFSISPIDKNFKKLPISTLPSHTFLLSLSNIWYWYLPLSSGPSDSLSAASCYL